MRTDERITYTTMAWDYLTAKRRYSVTVYDGATPRVQTQETTFLADPQFAAMVLVIARINDLTGKAATVSQMVAAGAPRSAAQKAFKRLKEADALVRERDLMPEVQISKEGRAYGAMMILP